MQFQSARVAEPNAGATPLTTIEFHWASAVSEGRDNGLRNPAPLPDGRTRPISHPDWNSGEPVRFRGDDFAWKKNLETWKLGNLETEITQLDQIG